VIIESKAILGALNGNKSNDRMNEGSNLSNAQLSPILKKTANYSNSFLKQE